MLRSIKESVLNMITSRIFVLILVFFALFGVLVYRLFELQIVHGNEYLDNFKLTIRKERTIPGTRGNIYDMNGELLAYNELAYSVMIEDVYESGSGKNRRLNDTISTLIDMIEEGGDRIENDFDIVLDENNNYVFTVEGTQLLRFLADVYGQAYTDKLTYAQRTATAQDVINYLAGTKKFAVGEYMDPENTDSDFIVGSGYTKEKLLQIITIRYAMSLNGYQKYIATTVAKDVSEETVAMVMENSESLDGVSVTEDTVRKYVDSVYFSHLIGYIGKISNEEYEGLSAENEKYSLTDIVGKAGIEQYMETTLQGTKGTEVVYVDNLGKVIETSDRKEPSAGNDVYLTIDKDLQKAVYNLLEQKIAGILVSNIENIKQYVADENASASKIRIPIYDVYFALFNNNIIDTGHFTHENAKETERLVLAAFESKQDSVVANLRSELETTATPYDRLPLEYQVYQLAIVDMLEENDVIKISEIDKEDETYLAWKKDENISMREYLSYLISRGWIDITKLSLESQYSDSEEIYLKLIDYIAEHIVHDSYFNKRLYKYMLLDDQITGRQVCLLLFEQNIIDGTDEEKAALESGAKTAYSFMMDKIKNLDITPAQLALDPCSGSCVVTDTNTGEVRACVTYPGYDNNRLTNSIDSEYYNKIYNDLSQPMWNYATQQLSAPGSTFKMVSATTALEEGVVSAGEDIICRGTWDTIKPVAKCWISPSAHGALSISGAIGNSCNCYFYETGYRLSRLDGVYDSDTGLSKLAFYADQFGLSDKSGIEISESAPKVSDFDAIRSSIGQGNNNYSTVGLARYVTTVANGGNCYNLSILDKTTDSEGNLLKDYTPELRNKVEISQSTWNAIHSGMRQVVQDKAYYEGLAVNVAGKTGTAQENKKRPNHALFVCYAPYEAPEIAIATRIAYGYASDNAAQMTKDVIMYYFGLEEVEELITGTAEDENATQVTGD
ncbi:MAG: penicillin-binding protein [Lachnospiraceae bacterium]|nr:penicillin-binding protein [Lachnospiraceae bacterium]